MRAASGLVRTGCRAAVRRELVPGSGIEGASIRSSPCAFAAVVLDSARDGLRPSHRVFSSYRTSGRPRWEYVGASGFAGVGIEGGGIEGVKRVEGVDLGKRLYVGNLPFSATEEELSALFGQHGAVIGVDLIVERETGRPRGFGFVEMEDSAAADAAIESLDGSDLGGRNLKVNEAQERRGGGGGGGRG